MLEAKLVQRPGRIVATAGRSGAFAWPRAVELRSAVSSAAQAVTGNRVIGQAQSLVQVVVPLGSAKAQSVIGIDAPARRFKTLWRDHAASAS